MHILEKANEQLILLAIKHWFFILTNIQPFKSQCFQSFMIREDILALIHFHFVYLINLSVNSVGFDQFCKLKSNVFKMAMKLSIMQYHNHLTRDIFCPSLHFIL